MRNLIALLCFLILSANGCKDSQINTNPKVDEAQTSNLFSGPASSGTLNLPELNEASGLAHSRSNPLYLWSHNDSGGSPLLYLFTTSGAESSRLELDGARNIDWEDMAIGLGPVDGVNYLYAADIGDNSARRGSLTIYRTPEPNLNAGIPSSFNVSSADYETIEYQYEDGARDAEALFVDPKTKDIYIISKREPNVILYRLPFPQSLTEMNTAKRVMVLPYTFITAADISPDGNELLIKNYFNVYHWQREGNQTIAEMLSQQPAKLNYEQEPQGEAIAWSSDGSRYFTISESNGETPVTLFRYLRN